MYELMTLCYILWITDASTVQPQASWWNEKLRGGELQESPVSIIVFFQGLLCNLPIYGPTSLPFPSWNSQSTQSFHCDIYLQFPVWVLRECVLMVHAGNIRRTVLCNNYPHQKGTFTMWAEHIVLITRMSTSYILSSFFVRHSESLTAKFDRNWSSQWRNMFFVQKLY